RSLHRRGRHSFPTRRSSDLVAGMLLSIYKSHEPSVPLRAGHALRVIADIRRGPGVLYEAIPTLKANYAKSRSVGSRLHFSILAPWCSGGMTGLTFFLTH